MNKKIVIIGAGVAGINAATKLVDNGYPGELITIIDKGNDPHNRLPEEVMTGMLGAGGFKRYFITTKDGVITSMNLEDNFDSKAVRINFYKFISNTIC